MTSEGTERAGPHGWYLDERDASGKTLRWWNGNFWGEGTRKATAAEVPARLGTTKTAEERAREAEARAAEVAKNRLSAIGESRLLRDTGTTRTFEYAIAELDEAAEAELNQAGSLGWELVGVAPGEGGATRCFLKREVWTEVDENGKTSARAPFIGMPGAAAAGAGGGAGFFAAGYYESGPDLDGDGDVDGGLFDSIGDLFG